MILNYAKTIRLFIMALFSNSIFYTPFNLLVLFAPLIYILYVRSLHRFCESYMNAQITNVIKNLTPVPSELTVRGVVLSYSFLLTMLLIEFVFSFAMLLLYWLF